MARDLEPDEHRPRPLRIAHVNDIAFVGSTLARAMRELGEDAVVVEPFRLRTNLRYPWKAAALPFRAAGLLGAAATVRRGHFDVVHVHYARLGMVGPLAGRPYALHVHGTDIRGVRPRSFWGRETAPLLRRAGLVYYATPDLEQWVRPFRDDAIFLPNPIETDRFRPLAADDAARPTRRDLLVGVRLAPIKGLTTILEVLRLLAAERPATTITIVAQGEGVEAARAAAGPNATIVAPASRDELAELMRGHRLALGQFLVGAMGNYEIEALSTGLKNSGRSIVLSLSPGPTPVNCSEHLKQFANLWRVSNDFWDNWKSLDHNFSLFAEWFGNGAPGHWPDGDMIPFGRICQRNCDVRPDRWTRFTRDEQLTLLSLWALAPSPLILGMNLPDNDAWTTAILTSPEVLAVDQDALGRQARRMTGDGDLAEMWVKELASGAYAVGFFNRTNQSVKVNYAWRHLGFLAAPAVRDLWLRQDLGRQEKFTASLPPHGCVLLRVK